MPNDAKFGLIVGLSLVLAAAALFFQKDQPAATPEPAAASAAAPAAVSRPPMPSAAAMLPSPAPLPRPGSDRDAPGRTASRRVEW